MEHIILNILILLAQSDVKIIYFNIAAVIIEVIVIISLINKKLFREKSDRAMLFTCFILLISSISGTFAVFFDNLGSGYIVAKYIFHSSYLIFHPLSAAFYLWYLISLTDTITTLKKNKVLYVAFILPAVLEIILIIVNIFTPLLFHFNDEGVYTHEGDFLFVLYYVFTIIYFIYGIAYILKYRKLFTIKWILTLFTPYIFILAAVIFETLVPKSNIELFITNVAFLFITFNIQSPEELTEFITKLGNDSNYENKIRRGFDNGSQFYIVCVNISGYMEFRDLLSSNKTSFLRDIARELQLVNKRFNLKALVCYLHSGYFRLVVEEENDSEIVEAVNEINTILNTKIKKTYKQLNPTTIVSLIHCPNDINNYDSLLSFNKEINNLKYEGKVYYACDLLKFEYYNTIININKITTRAFDNNTFDIYYQPIYSLKENKFTQAEALIRLYDELFGNIDPSILIPALEKNGQIVKIGPLVFEKVCRFMTSPIFPKLGIEHININLSIFELDQEDIVNKVMAILENYNVSPSKISIEITENAIANTNDKILENIEQFVKLGFKISMDDYGNGYSNIRRFIDYPIHTVKLDRIFVTNLINEKPTIVEDSISLFKHMNCKVVAEGVETKELKDQLNEYGVDYIQGYYYSKPLSEFDFVNFMQKENNEDEQK